MLGWSRLERLHRVIEEERWEIEHHRPQEREELRALYAAKGLRENSSMRSIEVLMADDNRLFQVMLEEELGLTLEAYEHPLKQAFGAFFGAHCSALCLFGPMASSLPWGAASLRAIVIALVRCDHLHNSNATNSGPRYRLEPRRCRLSPVRIYFLNPSLSEYPMTPTGPYIFDEFFASGMEESISPFLTPTSRTWGKNLSLKARCFSAFLLARFLLPLLSSLPFPISSLALRLFSRRHSRSSSARFEDFQKSRDQYRRSHDLRRTSLRRHRQRTRRGSPSRPL